MPLRARAKRLRNFVMKRCSSGFIPIAKRFGMQTRPLSHFPCVVEWSRSPFCGAGERYVEIEAPRKQQRTIGDDLLHSPLGEVFRSLEDGYTTRQFRLELVDARVYGHSGVVVHSSDRIFSEITFEYATSPDDFSFWNQVGIPTVRDHRERVGVAHSMSADNYSHWVMEVVPQLVQLKDDLDKGYIDAVYVRNVKRYQKEWLNLIGIDESRIVAAAHDNHIKAANLVVYSMPMRNCEFGPSQLALFRSFVPDAQPTERVFIGREGGNRNLLTSDGDLREVVESCGYRYVLAETLSVQEKLDLYANAAVIAGPHGAGLGGVVFADGRAEFREVHSPLVPNLCYWRIADSKGMPYRCALAMPEEGANKGVQQNLKITSRQLGEFLQ